MQFVTTDATRAPLTTSDETGSSSAATDTIGIAGDTNAAAISDDADAMPADRKVKAQQTDKSSDAARSALPAAAIAAAFGTLNGTASEASSWVLGSAASGAWSGLSQLREALLVGALLLLAVCVHIVRRALARRKARTSGSRPAGGGRLNRFLARRRTAEPNLAKP